MLKNISPKTSFFLGILAGLFIVSLVGGAFVGWVYVKNAQLKKQTESFLDNPSPAPKDLVIKNIISLDDHIFGNKNAQVTVVEFCSFTQPFCKMYSGFLKNVIQEHKDDTRWVYKHFYAASDAPAESAAIAAECAGKQEKFFAYTDELYKHQDELSDEKYKKLADDVSLNRALFDACLLDASVRQKIQEERFQAEALGMHGTPSLLLFDKEGKGALFDGAPSFSELEKKLDKILP